MVTLPISASKLWQTSNKTIHGQAVIFRDNASAADAVDMKQWLVGFTVNETTANQTASASIQLTRQRYDDSLVPAVKSRTNWRPLTGSFLDVLDVGKRVWLRCQYAALGDPVDTDNTKWVFVFAGFIDSIEYGSDTVTVNCRDYSSVLIDRQIERNEPQAGLATSWFNSISWPQTAEAHIQAIINAGTAGAGTFTLVTPVSPSWALAKYKEFSAGSVFKSINDLASKIGWEVRYKKIGNDGNYALTFWQAPRVWSGTPSFTLNADMYSVDGATQSIEDIRNKIIVIYYDSLTGQKKEQISQDATSQAKYGIRTMILPQDPRTAIDDSTEAAALADAALADLKSSAKTFSITSQFLGQIEVNDVILLKQGDYAMPQDSYLSVLSYQHSYSAKGMVTKITGKIVDTVANAVAVIPPSNWLRREQRAGVVAQTFARIGENVLMNATARAFPKLDQVLLNNDGKHLTLDARIADYFGSTNTGNKYVAPTDGTYRIDAKATADFTTAGTLFRIRIGVAPFGSGAYTTLKEASIASPSGAAVPLAASVETFYLFAGDQVRLEVYQTNAGATARNILNSSVDPNLTYLHVSRVS